MGKARRLLPVYEKIYRESNKELKRKKKEVESVGGLLVLGTERHISKRVDDQLRGRSGRQGEPGSSVFFVCLEDGLLRLFGRGPNRALKVEGSFPGVFLSLMKPKEGLSRPQTSSLTGGQFSAAQKEAETFFYSERKTFYEWNRALDTQRNHVYKERQKLVKGQRAGGWVGEYTWSDAQDIYSYLIRTRNGGEANKGLLLARSLLLSAWPSTLDPSCSGGYVSLSRQLWRVEYGLKTVEIKSLDRGLLCRVEASFILGRIDDLWSAHLQQVDFLKDFAGLQSSVWRPHLITYREKTFDALILELRRAKHSTVNYLSRLADFLF
jgi:preprotein translocase subunit SecA